MTRAVGSAGGSAALAATGNSVMGRAPLFTEAYDHLMDGGGLLLTGPAGIGKSTLLGLLTAGFADHHVLSCSLSETERHLPFLGLIDLLGGVGEHVLAGLPPHQRAALEAALLRRTDPIGERDVLGLRMAVLAVFRALCSERPVLLVVDDVQWLDAPSAELLAFLARRTRGLPLRVLAGLRVEPGERAEDVGLCPPPQLSIRVPPMSSAEIGQLLSDLDLPRAVLAKVHQASDGNPFFARELGRALAEHGPLDPSAPLPVPDSLRSLMLGRLRALSARAQRTLLIAGAAARPTRALLRGTGCDDAGLTEAVQAGIVVDGEVVRFTHPLLSAVLYVEAPERDRLDAHAALAEAVTDPVERARHLALVSPERDARVAATLSEAASAARRRGAPATAARLGLLAADRSPSLEREAGLRLTAAEDALAAGEFTLVRAIAQDVLDAAPGPTERVRAWILVLDSCGQGLAELDDVFPQALADAEDDPALLAPLRYRMAWRAWMVKGSAVRARDEAATSAELAAKAGDRSTEVLALTKRALAEFHLGDPEAERTLRRALSGPQDPRIMFDHNGPVYLRYRHHLMHDRLEEARAELRSLTYVVRQRGAVESLFWCLYSSAMVEAYRGRCDRAVDLAYQCKRLAEDSELSQGPACVAVAVAEAAGGSLDRALAAAERSVRHSEDDGDQLILPTALHILGHVRMARGEHHRAAETLRRVRRLETGQGLVDPAMRRWHADLAESLAATGHPDEATDLIEETRRDATRLGRRSVLATLDRAAALVTAAHGNLPQAITELTQATTTLATHPFPLEEARARLELGRLLARATHLPPPPEPNTQPTNAPPRAEEAPGVVGGEASAVDAALRAEYLAAARESLRAAQRMFARAKATPWMAAATAELDALDAGVRVEAAPLTGEADPLSALSGMERRVAALVAEGATNREIAARLYVSVKTVEAALTRTYRKLGVRSRVDLARIAAARRP